MRHRSFPVAPAIVFSIALAASPACAQVCNPAALWQNTNRVTRATSDALFGLGLSFVVTGPSLRAVWNESGTVPTPHAAGDTRWVWSTGGATINNFPNPVVLSADNQEYVFVGSADGRVYKIDASSGATAGSVDTRRPTCSADQVVATPAVQLYANSNATFRNDVNLIKGHPDDLVIVITKTGCGDHTSNRVLGYWASDLTIKWTFNDATTQLVDGSNDGCTVDYDTNRIYCGTDQALPTQPSLWGLNSMSGALAWSHNAGSIQNRPTLYLGNLYVVANGDRVQKHSATTGATVWSYPLPTTVSRSGSWQNKILVLDSGGALQAIEDAGTSATQLWGPVAPGGGLTYVSAPAVAPQHGKAYIGRNDGTIQQIELSTGAGGFIAPAISGSPAWDPTVDFSGPSATSEDRLVVPHADGTIARYCIPWGGPTAVPEPVTETMGFMLTARPNPTAGAMRMEFELPFSARVEVDVCAVTGQGVRSLLRAERAAGRHQAYWDGLDESGRPASAGIYFLRLRAVGAQGQIHERSRKVEILR